MVTVYTKNSQIVVIEDGTELTRIWEKNLKYGIPLMVVNTQIKNGFKRITLKTEDLVEIREDLDSDYYEN